MRDNGKGNMPFHRRDTRHENTEEPCPISQVVEDQELRSLLRNYAPNAPVTLENRIMASYRKHMSRTRYVASKSFYWTWRLALIAALGTLILLAATHLNPFWRASVNPGRGTPSTPGAAPSKPEIPPSRAQVPNSGESASPSQAGAGAAAPIPGLPRLPGTDPTAHTIIFHVVDAATGRGIEAAALDSRVSFPGESAPPAPVLLTDKNGHCAVSAPNQSFPNQWSVTVRADGYVSQTVSFPPSYPEEYTCKLEKGIMIGGFVRNEDGKPIPDVRVRIVSVIHDLLPSELGVGERLTVLDFQTDESGQWTGKNVSPNSDYLQLTLTHPEYVRKVYSTQLTPLPLRGESVQSVASRELEAGTAILVMKYGLEVAGTILDSSGKPVEGATVTQIDPAVVSGALQKATIYPAGRFLLTNAKPGEMVLLAQAKGKAPALQTVRVKPKMPPIEFHLVQGQVVRGRVVDDQGTPVPGARISTSPNQNFNREYFPWQDRTDADGRFLWDSAPAQVLYYLVLAEGFEPVSPNIPLKPGEDHEVKLRRLLAMRFFGKVIDAGTKMPIDKFKAQAFVEGSLPNASAAAEGSNGEFTLTLRVLSNEIPNKFRFIIRIEAQGYRPDSSQTVDVRDGDRSHEFALVRADGLSGVLLLPSGEPVKGANVYLFGAMLNDRNSTTKVPALPVMLRPGSLSGMNPTSGAVTDESGRFSFDPMPEAHTVMAVHEKGFVAVTAGQFAASPALTLEPWGGIRGTVRIGEKTAANQGVFLNSLIGRPIPPELMVSLRVITDAEGNFEFPSLPPGEYRVTHIPSSASAAQGASALAVVRSGETTSVTIGGMGRPIIGRIEITGQEGAINWKALSPLILELKLPETQAPTWGDVAAYTAWSHTEEGMRRLRSERRYGLMVASDGSFRVEDVLPGTYVISIRSILLDRSRPASEMITLRELVVAEIPGGRSDTPLDFGVITLQLPAKR